jgi:hypothetical protein
MGKSSMCFRSFPRAANPALRPAFAIASNLPDPGVVPPI